MFHDTGFAVSDGRFKYSHRAGEASGAKPLLALVRRKVFYRSKAAVRVALQDHP
jgi:hypothetical protein